MSYTAAEIKSREPISGLYVGRPVSMLVEGKPSTFHPTWHVFMVDDSGEHLTFDIIGPGFQTKAAAVGYALYREEQGK